jgi:hypothetical protein
VNYLIEVVQGKGSEVELEKAGDELWREVLEEQGGKKFRYELGPFVVGAGGEGKVSKLAVNVAHVQ